MASPGRHSEHVCCFVVVTREARDASGEVHDRMSALLTPDSTDAWLEPVKLDRGGRKPVLATLDGSSAAVAATMQQYIVDRKVNNSLAVDSDDPSVIRQVA